MSKVCIACLPAGEEGRQVSVIGNDVASNDLLGEIEHLVTCIQICLAHGLANLFDRHPFVISIQKHISIPG